MGGFLTICVRSPCCIEDFHVKNAKKNARLQQAGEEDVLFPKFKAKLILLVQIHAFIRKNP